MSVSPIRASLQAIVPNVLSKCPIISNQQRILASQPNGKPRNIVIEYSSPNIAKPFHFGHLKSTILGNYLSNLHKFVGNHVTRLNYIGDWGTQYGLLSLGMSKFADDKESELLKGQSALKYLLDIYIKANQLSNSDEAFYSEARRQFLLMDRGKDPELMKQWKQIRDISLDELKKSYLELNIEFDDYECESDYAAKAYDIYEQLNSKKLITVLENGLKVVEVLKNKLHHVPILKSDGSSLYITRDIAAALDRAKKYDFDQMLYVVGIDQERHFDSMSKILKNMGHDWHDKLVHVKVGKVLKMSTRSGNFLLLDDIINEATERYIESTKKTVTSKVKTEEDILMVARNLALSSLFVYDMRNRRTRHYEFDWDVVIMSSDRSGINLQTTYARLASLMEKASSVGLEPLPHEEIHLDAIACEEAVELLTRLEKIGDALMSSFESMDASPVVNHALFLCKAINKARKCDRLWVIGEADERNSRSRLTLFKSALSQLDFIIRLIGLKPLKKV